MNTIMKRVISMVLCFVMVLGFVPANVFAATGEVIDAAIFCSDVHGNPSTVTSVFNGIKSADSTFKPSTASFVGDTQCAASSVTSAAQSVYSDVKCYYAFGNHDDEGNYGIEDVTGLIYGDEDTNYYIYAISENSMASSKPSTTDFTNTVADLDKSKPLFIISHLPLHSRRGDSNGAAVWYPAISEAAKSMDIFFFWAHNHTGEGAADTAAYYVAKNGSETITLEDTTTVVTPNFTYANAGYIQPPNGGARTKAATAVRIYEDSVNLTVYTTSGELTGTYAVNETITREFADSTDNGDSGSTGETTPPTTEGTTTVEKEVYVLVDTMTVGKDYLIVNTNAAGAGYAMNHSSGTEGAVEVSIQESGDYIYIDLDDSTAVWTATTKSSGFELMNGSYYLEAYGSTSAIEISTTQAYSARYWVYDSSASTLGYFGGNGDHYVYYDSGFVSAKNSGSEAVYIYEKQTITVSSDGTVSGGGDSGDDNTGSGDSGNTGDSTETVVGEATVNTATDGSWQTVTFGTTKTETKTKTVYVLSSGNPSGNVLIADANSAGTVHLVANDGGDLSNTTTTVIYGDSDGDGDSEYYIELTDTEATNSLWAVSGSYTFENQDEYLRYNNGLSVSGSSTTWSYSNNYLSYYSNRTTNYLRYNSGWTTTSRSSSATSIYFYTPTTVEYEEEVSSSTTYSLTASDIEHFYTADTTDTETVTITKSVTEGTPDGTYAYQIVEGGDEIITSIDENGVITFNGTEGTAQVKVSYSWTVGEGDEAVTYTIWQVIDVTATAPYYKVELCDPVTDEDGTTTYVPITAPIALKGIEAGDTYSIWAVIKEYNKQYPEGNDLGDVEDNRLLWTVDDSSIATIDPATGVITFTGNKYGTFEVTVHYLDENGESLCQDTVTISATESQYVVPGDGTNDFPEYPEQGAIRFDKTAVAQGNFSQSGIAKVELSMTGVPYGTNVKTDVVVMVDMTASMSDDDVTAAEEAVQELIESLVYDEENDKYDSNIQLFIDVFYSASSDSSFETEEYLNCVTISNAEELAAAKAKIDFTQSSSGGGTRYNLAMKDVYETLNRDGHAEKQFVVFVSDGVPTAYAPLSNGTLGTTLTGDNDEEKSLADGWFDLETGAVTSSFQTEYYSYLIKTAGISIYTVGCNLTALTEPALVLDHMSSNYSADGKTATGETKYSFFCTTSGGITDEVLEIFHNIGAGIREAATNVVVEDKIDSRYTLNFSLPENVTAAEAGNMDDFYIQVLGYELNENNDRKENPTVLEKFLFNNDGTIVHTIGATTCDSCTHVTKTDGVVTAIDGTYFDYTIDAKGDEFLTWTAEKLDRTELALEYFVYLDHSAGEAAADQVDPGTYPTNEYATITYTNFNGKECQQYFPIPTMTWMGAKVTYVFYLVNEDGQPVNRAGKVIPFAEAIFVTDPVTYDVTWNEEEGMEKLDAAYLAQDKVPDVYQLYDNQAYYEILVYQTEGVDKETQAVNYNHFIIEGSSAVGNKETTKVYNTKAGNRFDDYGAYSATAGSYTSTKSGTSYTATVTKDIDYANTTVAFAVVWKPELNPDAVVIDYGLDVIIDVTTNDALASGVVGVSTTKPDAEINKGTYKNSVMGTSAELMIGDLIIGTAKVENLTSVRFSLNESSGMQFSEPVEFYYESACNYYTYDGENKTLNTTHMYSSVTVIPATTIYYEDDFLSLNSYTKDSEGNWKLDEKSAWTTEGTRVNETQDQDRPGKSQISAALDADNNYGYDSAYETMAEHSLGSSAKITVDATHYGEATFTFYGTGFDLISLTSGATGTITVKVTDEAGNTVTNTVVDTYYGMEEDGTVVGNTPDTIYQVPVIKVDCENYGKYTVKITAAWNDFFDHIDGSTSYDLYLDAVRIYNPTGDENQTANDAYIKDGEAYPVYEELRDKIIAASEFTVVKNDDGTFTVSGNGSDEALAGGIFIDCNDEVKNIADYVSYGPNNELYLANGQAIAFTVDVTETMADVQLGIKVANGGSVTYKINGDTYTVETTTDMYYSIWEYAKDGGVVTIENVDGGILSLTNIKATFNAATATNGLLRMTAADAETALTMLCGAPAVEEPTEPTEPETEPTEPETEPTEPETEPTEPETEPTEPETTEPEVTEPEEDNSDDVIKETVAKTIRKIVKKLFGWLFG